MFATCTTAQELPPLPSQEEPIPYQEWANYADALLREVYPEHEELIERVEYAILDSKDPLINTKDLGERQVFQFSIGLIQTMESPEEFAVQLGHELGHLVRGHRARDYKEIRDIISGDDPTLIFEIIEEEISVDIFAGLAIPDGMCVIHVRNERNYPLFFEHGEPSVRVLLQMNVRRALFRDLCAYLQKDAPKK